MISFISGEDPNNFDDDKFLLGSVFDPNGVGLAMQIEVQAVPEPSTIWLFSIGGLALFAFRRV